jgi:CcmD family protein
VFAVLLIILTGIFIYLIRLDRKMSRLEKDGK